MEHNIAWPAQSRISHETGLTEPTVRKWLQYLAKNEWLIIRKKAKLSFTKGGNQYHNEYLISIPDEIIRRVNDFPSCQKGGKTDNQRGVNESSKVGKQFTPNNNDNTKENNEPAKKNLAVCIPEKWNPNNKNIDWLNDAGLSEFEQQKVIRDFRDYWLLCESKKSNWDLAFRRNPIVKSAVNRSTNKKLTTKEYGQSGI